MKEKLMFCIACIILAIFLWLTIGCQTQRLTASDSTTAENKTVITEDSTGGIPKDVAWMDMYLTCDSMGNVLLWQLDQEQGQRVSLEFQFHRLQDLYNQAQQQLAQANEKLSDKFTTAIVTEKPNANNIQVPNVTVFSFKAIADSLNGIIRNQRVLIEQYEKVSKTQTDVVEVVPKKYKDMAAGFWVLLVIDVLVIALLVWRNWGKIGAFFLRLFARFI